VLCRVGRVLDEGGGGGWDRVLVIVGGVGGRDR